MSRVVVAGGGPAGMMAAISAAEAGHRVILVEKNEKLGKKLYITGKGRCNLTNAGGADDFFSNVQRNRKFLYSAYYSFDPEAVMAFFQDRGLGLKVERGNRVFPQSDKASDVTRILQNEAKRLKVETRFNVNVTGLLTENCPEGEERGMKVTGVKTDAGDIPAENVILATGGISYPATGSTGDGYIFAEDIGISRTMVYPSLVPLETGEGYVPAMQGLSLKNVVLSVYEDGASLENGGGRAVFSEMGELLFTHFGISGPLGLSASCVLTEGLAAGGKYKASIDLKPALTKEMLTARILREVEESPRKRFSTILPSYLPGRMADVFAGLMPKAAGRVMAEFTRADREEFIGLLKAFPFTITGTRGFGEAIITRGGIDVGEVDPSTMESRRVRGLFFAGEVIDVDARTGGYNLQIAWCTGRLAGMSVH